MAHVTVSKTPKENKETTTLLWFNPNIGHKEDTKQTQDKLREINDYVSFYEDLQLCIDYIQSAKNEKIFLITSGKQASQILPAVLNLRQIDSIFIFCMKIERYEHLTNEYTKIIGIYNNLDQLSESIREQMTSVDQQIQTLSFFNQHEQSTKDLSKESGKFIWFQLFKYVILRLPHDEKAKKEMIETCRNYYRGYTKQMKLIEKFEKEYRSEDAIRWYSEQSFVYKLVNKALRTGDYDQLHRFRYFISDLSNGLQKEHENLLSSNEEILTVYRGAKLHKEEFEQLNQNVSKLISTNGYLSTSRDRSLALSFAKKSTKRPDVIPVLFQIQCDIKQIDRSIIFADIEKLSAFPGEQEVLFDIDAAFRIDSIETDGERKIIKMTVTNEAQNIGRHFIEETQREAGDQSITIVFGKLMCNLGEYDKSQKYFEQMLNEPNGEDLAWIEYNIGQAFDFKGEWDEARKFYDRAYDRMINAKPSRIKDSAAVLDNIGGILYHQGKHDEALDYYQRSLKIYEKFYPSGHVHIATSLNNTGSVLDSQGKHDEALDYYQRSLKMREKFYPSGHVDIANSLNNIGYVLDSQGKYEEALDYHQRSLKIYEKFYPSGHVDIATSLNNIGSVLNSQGKHDEALDYYQRSLKMREKFYPSGHVHIATSLNNIGSVLNSQGKYEEALDYYQRSLKIYEKFYPSGHVDIANSLNNIGYVLDSQGKHDEALDYYQRSLKMREKFYPSGHVDIADSLLNIGVCYTHQNQNKRALDYFQRAMSIYEKFLPSGHPSRVRAEKNIRAVSCNIL